MNEEQIFSDDEELSNESGSAEKIKRRVICTPYIQIFKNGKRIYQSIKKK